MLVERSHVLYSPAALSGFDKDEAVCVASAVDNAASDSDNDMLVKRLMHYIHLLPLSGSDTNEAARAASAVDNSVHFILC